VTHSHDLRESTVQYAYKIGEKNNRIGYFRFVTGTCRLPLGGASAALAQRPVKPQPVANSNLPLSTQWNSLHVLVRSGPSKVRNAIFVVRGPQQAYLCSSYVVDYGRGRNLGFASRGIDLIDRYWAGYRTACLFCRSSTNMARNLIIMLAPLAGVGWPQMEFSRGIYVPWYGPSKWQCEKPDGHIKLRQKTVTDKNLT